MTGPAPEPSVAGVLLAAGAGERFGGPKALVRWGDRLLVERGVALLRGGGCMPVVVVLGARADEVLEATDLDGADPVVNDDWAEGMGSSLRAGLAAVDRLDPPDRGPAAAVVALVDQPLVTPAAVERLVRLWRRTRPDGPVAVVATYGGRLRNPVLLDRSVFAEVARSAVDDVGARDFVRDGMGPDGHGRVATVPCDDTGSPADVDTPEDLAILSALYD